MALRAFRLAAAAVVPRADRPPRHPDAGPAFFAGPGGRLFFDITSALRSTFGRRVLDLAMRNMEARTAPILQHLTADPRLSAVHTPEWSILRAVLPVLIRGRTPPRSEERRVGKECRSR